MASPNLKRHLYSRPRQRGSPETSKTRELDRGRIVFVFSVKGMVTLDLAFSATLDTVPRPLYRARYVTIVSRDWRMPTNDLKYKTQLYAADTYSTYLREPFWLKTASSALFVLGWEDLLFMIAWHWQTTPILPFPTNHQHLMPSSKQFVFSILNFWPQSIKKPEHK